MSILLTVLFFVMGAAILLFSVEAFAKNVLNKRFLPKLWLDWFWNGLITNKWFWVGFCLYIIAIVIHQWNM